VVESRQNRQCPGHSCHRYSHKYYGLFTESFTFLPVSSLLRLLLLIGSIQSISCFTMPYLIGFLSHYSESKLPMKLNMAAFLIQSFSFTPTILSQKFVSETVNCATHRKSYFVSGSFLMLRSESNKGCKPTLCHAGC